jgi:hypothetical protein
MNGRVLSERLLEVDHSAELVVPAEAAASAPADAALSAEEEEELRDRLRKLGYLG